jgi:hypothetical protein
VKCDGCHTFIYKIEKQEGQEEEAAVNKAGPGIIKQARYFILISMGKKIFRSDGEVFIYPDKANADDERDNYPEIGLKKNNELRCHYRGLNG